MHPMRKYGLRRGVTADTLQDQIWDIGWNDYDTNRRRNESMASMRRSQNASQAASQVQSSVPPENSQNLEIKEIKEQSEEDQHRSISPQRRKVDEYQVLLEITRVKSRPDDLIVYVDRVTHPVEIEDVNVLYIPWNKLSTKVECSNRRTRSS